MAKYLIPDFCEVENPEIVGLIPSFKVGDEFVRVRCTIVSGELQLYPVNLGQMPNTDNWGDKEVLEFATKQLETFKVKE